MLSDVCVSTTARQAAERGYDVLLAKEAIGGEFPLNTICSK